VKPEFNWKPWKFQYQPSLSVVEKDDSLKWWLTADSSTMKSFLSDVAEYAKLSRTDLNDWHKILARHVHHVGGPLLLNRFHGSVPELLRFSVPDYPWLDWLFESQQPGEDFWRIREARRAFLDWVFDHLKLDKQKGLDAWYGTLLSHNYVSQIGSKHSASARCVRFGAASPWGQ
jgi:hypothetical protein